jgi:hypothetical protein
MQERGLRPGHKLTVVAAAVIAAIVAYWAFASILGMLYLVMRHAGRRKL